MADNMHNSRPMAYTGSLDFERLSNGSSE